MSMSTKQTLVSYRTFVNEIDLVVVIIGNGIHVLIFARSCGICGCVECALVSLTLDGTDVFLYCLGGGIPICENITNILFLFSYQWLAWAYY